MRSRSWKNIEIKEDCTYVFRTFTGKYKGERICAIRPYFGAPASAVAFETAIATGGKYFLMVGEAGAINEPIRIGDIILPTWAMREEGTSYHYMPSEYVPRPSRRLLALFEDAIKQRVKQDKIKIFKGGIWITDALFRETEDKVKTYAEHGILGVEMESSALMSIAEFRDVELAVALAVSDELYRDSWRSGFGCEYLKTTEKLLVESALDTLAAL